MVISLVELKARALENEFIEYFMRKKPGCLGSANTFSLPNMRATSDMTGLSSGDCCTHKRLTWMQRITSDKTNESFTVSSMSSNALPSFHSTQACTMKN